jgi:hypothetical protein
MGKGNKKRRQGASRKKWPAKEWRPTGVEKKAKRIAAYIIKAV